MPETCRDIYDNEITIVASSWYLWSFSYMMHGHTYIRYTCDLERISGRPVLKDKNDWNMVCRTVAVLSLLKECDVI